MKILVVCQYYHPEPFRISDICEALVKKGHTVTVLTGLPNYPEGYVLDNYRHGKKKNEMLNGVKIIRCFEIGRGNNKLKLFLNYFSYAVSATFKALFMKEEFDVVFVNQLSPVMMCIPAIAYKKRHNKKILLYCLDLWPDSLNAGGVKEDSIIYKMFYKLSKWIYSSADMILVTSSMFKDYFENTLKLNIDNIKHLPQYAEDLFTMCKAVTMNDSLNLVFAGNIGDMQSVETIVRAANELRNNTDIIFHIIGDGSKLELCKDIAKDFGLENVKFYGRRPLEEMLHFYEMADAMLITLKNNKSLEYTLPGKVQSYMAAGKPIIGAINGETRLLINVAKCGLCCDSEDFLELSKKILEFSNSTQRKEMGENARNYYMRNFDKMTFIDSLENELRSIIKIDN